MNSDRHQRLTDLLDEALERPASERQAFLAAACGDDVELQREVQSLLLSFEQASSFIEAPAFAGASDFLFADDQPMEGRQIGHYRIVRELGRGGMGAVYLAERADEYREQVALKIVKRGMDTDFVVRRFRHERQILASLHHPNIARLLDGGTTEDGLPYFVMEYIEGEPIDQYCDHHNLPIQERLKLFRTVCAAVQYAHQNLVIHRDLKPGNILITADGTVKLLDFGIAKILNPEISQTVEKTATLMRLMTPEYASPEQVRGELVTTASDVYSLGVVLYELLTGHRPYRITSILPSDIERIICEQEPTRPSTVGMKDERGGMNRKKKFSSLIPHPSSLKGDLDNIVLMALRKEPQRRYATAEQLAEDIRRHLEGLPVSARSDTFSYRAGKFVQRHKAGVAAAALIVLSLIAGLITTIWQARRAQAQQAKAERRFNDVRKLANSYLFEFHDAIEKLPGSTEARKLVVNRALEYLDSLAREAGDDPSLQQELAAAYLKVGDVQGRPGFPNLGDTAGALSSYRKSLAIREALPTAWQARLEAQRELATNCDRVGDASRMSGDAAGALTVYQKALAVRETLMKEEPGNRLNQRDLADSYQRIGDTLAQMGKPAEALAEQRKALPMFEAVFAADATNPETKRKLFIGYIKMGDRLRGVGDHTGSLASYRQGLLYAQELADRSPEDARAQRELTIPHEKIGNALMSLKQLDGAIASYRESLNIRARLAAADEKNAEAQRDLSNAYTKIADMLATTNDITGALANYGAALKIDEQLSVQNPSNMQVLQDRANSHTNIGDLHAKQNQFGEAIKQYQQAVKLRQQVADKDDKDMEVRGELASSLAKLGDVCMKLATTSAGAQQREAWNQARQWYQQSLTLLLLLQQRGALSKDAAGEPERIKSEIAKCDAALK
ncbi:MAG TPA: protein kinase [Blastocatellia bacterium]|nr:protein kinase [Blastocatellia bacterium]